MFQRAKSLRNVRAGHVRWSLFRVMLDDGCRQMDSACPVRSKNCILRSYLSALVSLVDRVLNCCTALVTRSAVPSAWVELTV